MKFILCAGYATRWQYHTPKQLIEIEGEQLLFRTEKLLERDAVVVTSNRLLLKHCRGFRTLIPDQQDNILQSILSTSQLWEDVNTFYLGDVYYTRDCIDVINNTRVQDIHFIGSKREIFAVKMRNTDRLKSIITVCARIEDARLWNLYYYMTQQNAHPSEHIEPTSNGVFTVVNDGTRDFDYYSDYASYRRRGSL